MHVKQIDPVRPCLKKLSVYYHIAVTYQPANRFWPFQWIETILCLVIAAFIGLGCVFLVDRIE